MNLKFVRNSVTCRIFHSETRRLTRISELLVLDRDGIYFELVDENGKDVKALALSKHKDNTPYVVDPDIYGSPAPLFSTKHYPCSDCNKMNPNRYRCTDCWERFSKHNDTTTTHYY